MSYEGKVVIVTGSSAGIGAAAAKLFAQEGAKLTLTGRDVERLRQVESECERLSGVRPLVIAADVCADDAARAVVDGTAEHFGRIDVLVNNAGTSSITNILAPDYLVEYDRIMATNLRAAVVITHAALPHLVKTKGNIINVSSMGGMSPAAGIGHYCTSKAALDQFSRCVALKVAPKGVRINTINPGPVRLNIFRSICLSNEQRQANEKHLPSEFILEPEEVGNLMLYLASDKARSITGSSFVIDVGALLIGANTVMKTIWKSN
ncbi:Glucose 1-dehydrogenase 2 [Eumeta japonica]|uniref:Glucose 1-dehydrogenase 2 n=1 Tax=Eumeta variegata TaxID=151549 RepID=A0A4C1T298_EUMVA|nr:Glucose 1-dehydrogenase 2 [Eumeta japonica]